MVPVTNPMTRHGQGQVMVNNDPSWNSRVRFAISALVLCGSWLSSGCEALTNPVGDAIPVRKVPPELMAPSKDCEEPLPLSLLRQPRPDLYRLGPGDVLGVYIEDFLGDRNLPLPVHVGPLLESPDQRRIPASAGYPVPVLENGTIALPLVEPLQVQGLSLAEARKAIRDHYVKERLLKAETDRILVTLLNPRQHQVLVFRQEALTFTPGPAGLNKSKIGTGQLVRLPAYENDILHALALTGGLPGQDAVNAVVIYRDCFQDRKEGELLMQQLQGKEFDKKSLPKLVRSGRVTRIPLSVTPGETIRLNEEEIVLRTGDVVFLERRKEGVFYTAGLLPPGVFPLPRDYDVDVIEAITMVRGPLLNGAFGGSNLSGTLIQPGIGNPSPSLLVVVRNTPDGGQLPIRVDLRKAFRAKSERLTVQPGDVLILQETPGEALARYTTQTFFNFNMVFELFRESSALGVIDVSSPDRLTDRLNPFFRGLP